MTTKAKRAKVIWLIRVRVFKLRPMTRAGRRRAEIDAVLAAYSAWRQECALVRAAYGQWARAATTDSRRAAFTTYRVALEREERAADRYARLLDSVESRPELDVGRQLAALPATSGAA